MNQMYRKRKSTKSKKLQWYNSINDPLHGLGIEQQMMAILAKEITKEIDDEIIKAMKGEHNAFNSMSPVKDGTNEIII